MVKTKSKRAKRAKRNTKKGGSWGIHAWKTEKDNHRNWERIWQPLGNKEYDPNLDYPSRRGYHPTPKTAPVIRAPKDAVYQTSMDSF